MPFFFRCLFAASAFVVSLNAQPDSPRFRRISVEDGLSENSTFSVYQDSRGFMWFGTNDGLNRYDGYRFVVYKPDPRLPRGLFGNRVFDVYEDARGDLWIGTNGGLNRFDRETETFERFLYDPDDPASLSSNHARAIIEDDDGALWIGTNGGGLVRLDSARESIRVFQNHPNDPATVSDDKALTLFIDSRGDLWIGTLNGLNRFNPDDETFERFVHDPDDPTSINHNYAHAIEEEAPGVLLVGTSMGLNRFDVDRDLFTELSLADEPQNVWALKTTSRGDLFVGTLGGGVYRRRSDESRFRRYQSDESNPSGLSSDYVWSIHEDRAGVVWFGTDIGVNALDPLNEQFRWYRADPRDPRLLSDNEVQAVLKDRRGALWVGTKDGLNRYEEGEDRCRRHFADPTKHDALGDDFIRALYEDSDGNLWIGANGGGLHLYHPETDGFSRYPEPGEPSGVINDKILSICEDADGSLWVGTLRGVNRFDRRARLFVEHYEHDPYDSNTLSNNYVHSVFVDDAGRLWVGCSEGLNLFDRERGAFVRFVTTPGDPNSLSNNLVWDVYQDRTGTLWICTNGGLNRYREETADFQRVSADEYLFNGAIYGLLESDDGALWASGNEGVFRYDPTTGEAKRYDDGDGLQSLQFKGGARFRSDDGVFYFGGVNGVSAFRPEELRDNLAVPPVALTDFRLHNRGGATDSSARTKAISETERVTLSHRQNSFTIEFAALAYSFPNRNRYRYKLVGLEEEWSAPTERNFAIYTNLDPGVYTFRVVGSNDDGVWNTVGASLVVEIDPPFWRTWWFATLIAVAVVAFAAWVVYYRVSQLLAIERLRSTIAADLHDDVGARLTEISMLSDKVKALARRRDDPTDAAHKIGSIARTMIEHFSDIIWIIDPKRDSLYEMFIKLKDGFEETLNRKNVALTLRNMETLNRVRLPMETRRNLFLLFKEALHNSLKHAEPSEISIAADAKDDALVIELTDDGVGFDPAALGRVNGLANMRERARRSGGALIVRSKPGEGATIRFEGKSPGRRASRDVLEINKTDATK